MKHSAAAEQPRRRRIDGFAGAIEMMSENPTQPANAGTVRGFREYRLRMEPGDKDLRAGGLCHKSARYSNRAIGAEDRAQRDRHGQDHRTCDKLSRNHCGMSLARLSGLA